MSESITAGRARASRAKRAAVPARRDPERTRETILAAAEVEFAAKGLSGARVDAIARRAGANKRMLYHYFGGKDGLYLAVLERVYAAMRGAERQLDLDPLPPAEAIRTLVGFNVDYCAAHPEMISLFNNENLLKARHIRGSGRVRELHSPLVDTIARILERGVKAGLFRGGVDPVQLYVSIAALGYFYYSNNATLSAIFGRDLKAPPARAARRAHAAEVILGYLRREPPA